MVLDSFSSKKAFSHLCPRSGMSSTLAAPGASPVAHEVSSRLSSIMVPLARVMRSHLASRRESVFFGPSGSHHPEGRRSAGEDWYRIERAGSPQLPPC